MDDQRHGAQNNQAQDETMTTPIEVTVVEFETGLPPQELSPNRQGHWSEKYRAKADYKNDVYVDCRVAIAQRYATLKLPWPRARLSLVFGTQIRRGDECYHPTDPDNALSAWKAGLDAVVAAGIVRDDKASMLELGEIRIDPESYGVVVRLERMK